MEYDEKYLVAWESLSPLEQGMRSAGGPTSKTRQELHTFLDHLVDEGYVPFTFCVLRNGSYKPPRRERGVRHHHEPRLTNPAKTGTSTN